MTKIKIVDWKEGFRKVSFTKLLCAYSNLTLSEAKENTDNILNGISVIIDVDNDKVDELIKEFDVVGALYKIED